jgi:hypothetical protein
MTKFRRMLITVSLLISDSLDLSISYAWCYSCISRSMNSDNMTAAEQASDEQHAEIAQRAYELYLERGCAAGEDLDDWLRAERELLEKDHELAHSGRRETEKGSAAATSA